MAVRKLKDVRASLKKAFSEKHKDPALRLTYQIVDLQLLKYSMQKAGELDTIIYECIDNCIAGFTWLYENGGTYNEIPAIVSTDMTASTFYKSFLENWGLLQEYMQTHMGLMDN